MQVTIQSSVEPCNVPVQVTGFQRSMRIVAGKPLDNSIMRRAVANKAMCKAANGNFCQVQGVGRRVCNFFVPRKEGRKFTHPWQPTRLNGWNSVCLSSA